jgi:hypothetical protein
MADVVGAFLWTKAVDNVSELLPERLHAANSFRSQQGLELGESLLDRIQVGAVRRQVQHARASCVDGLDHARDFVGAQIVHHHDVAFPQSRNKNLLHISKKQRPIHRAIEHAGRDHPEYTQGGHERGGPPVPVRHGGDQALAALGAAVQPGHVRLRPGLVDEDQPLGVQLVLVLAPFGSRLSDVRPVLLGGAQRLFFNVKPSSLRVSDSRPLLADTL